MQSERSISAAVANPCQALFAACLIASAMACSSPPKAQSPESQNRVHQVLALYQGENSLNQFVGAHPATCLKGSPTTQLCEWLVGTRHAGWASLAAAIETDDYINLLCELTLDGSARAADSCTAHPRRSNRSSWRWRYPKKKGQGVRQSPDEIAKMREPYRQIANQAIANATTLVELSRLMGTMPNECKPTTGDRQACLWRTTNQTFGHGTLVMWIVASKGEKIRFQCTLPINGTKRAPGSCSAHVGVF